MHKLKLEVSETASAGTASAIVSVSCEKLGPLQNREAAPQAK